MLQGAPLNKKLIRDPYWIFSFLPPTAAEWQRFITKHPKWNRTDAADGISKRATRNVPMAKKSWRDNYGGKYLKASDLPEDGKKVKIAGVEEATFAKGERPKLVAELHDGSQWCLNATNCELLEKILGSDDPDEWVGGVVEIYNDPTVRGPSGERTGGIRCRAAKKAALAGKKRRPEPEPGEEEEEPFDADLDELEDDDL